MVIGQASESDATTADDSRCDTHRGVHDLSGPCSGSRFRSVARGDRPVAVVLIRSRVEQEFPAYSALVVGDGDGGPPCQVDHVPLDDMSGSKAKGRYSVAFSRGGAAAFYRSLETVGKTQFVMFRTAFLPE